MDKLLNISREGGYPMCAETLQVLYDNARTVNVLLAGLNLPNNSAVLLGAENGAVAHNGHRYLYAFTIGNRRLVRYRLGEGISLTDLSSAKVVITETAFNVTDSNEQPISNVYSEERAEIVSTDVATEKWTFYNLKDVLEPAIYKDLLPEFRAQLVNTNVSLDENFSNILCKNDRKLRIKLKMLASVPNINNQVLNSPSYTLQVPMPITVQGAHSLNMVMGYSGNNYTMRAILEGNVLYVYAGEILNSITPTTTTIIYTQSWTMYINTEILL